MSKIKKLVKKVLAERKNNVVDFITKGSDKLSKEERKDINKAFEKEGLDGNGRFSKVDHALSKIGSILDKEGIEWDEILSGDRFKGDKGRQTLNIARKTADSFSPEKIKNSMVVFTWHLMSEKPHKDSDIVKDKKFEVLAYMS
ncbi:hypothetical protein N9948_01345 [bacterium]|nr:hypothetical protein [bacterium]